MSYLIIIFGATYPPKNFRSLQPMQMISFKMGATRLPQSHLNLAETTAFVRRQLRTLLQGGCIEPLTPPPLSIACSHLQTNVGNCSYSPSLSL